MSEKIAEQSQFEGLDFPRFESWFTVTLLSLIVLELSWSVPWFQLLTGVNASGSSLRAYLVFGLTLVLAFGVSQAAAMLRLRQRVHLLLLAVFLTVNILGAFILLKPGPAFDAALPESVAGSSQSFQTSSSVWVIVLFVFLGWWRGVGLAKNGLGPGHVLARVRAGMVMIFIYGLVGSSRSTGPNYVHFFLFIIAALLAMVGARLSTLHRLRGGRSSPLDPFWVAGMGATVAVLVGLAGVAAAVARGPLSDLISRTTNAFIEWTTQLFVYFLAPVLSIAIWAMDRFLNWLEQSAPPEAAQHPQVAPSPYEEFLQQIRETPPTGWADELFVWVRTVLIVVLVLVFLWLLLSRLRGIHVSGSRREYEERESMLGKEAIAGKLRSAFRRGLNSALDRLWFLSDRDRWLAASRIRSVYAQLMELSSSLGKTRPTSVTPLEFLPALKELFPSLDAELETITHAYVRVRYGELPETRKEIESVEYAWSRVHDLGRELYYKEVGFLRA
jgi:hypothetical protein